MVPVVCYTGMPSENHAGGSVRGLALDWINSGWCCHSPVVFSRFGLGNPCRVAAEL